MHRVIFIVYPGFELLDLSGPASVFNGANRALRMRGDPFFYEVVPASAHGGSVASSSGVSIETQAIATLAEEPVHTLLVVGAEREELLPAIADPALRAALPALARQSERYGSVCTGGFALAALGLLDGCRIATHW